MGIENVIHTFINREEFEVWKADEEAWTSSSFVPHCGCQLIPNSKVWYYYSNQAGDFKNKSKGQRLLKSQGTAKIGHQCSAYMKLSENMTMGVATLNYCKNHHSHEIKLAHLRIPFTTILNIAAKLQQGIKMEQILDDIRDSVTVQLTRNLTSTREWLTCCCTTPCEC